MLNKPDKTKFFKVPEQFKNQIKILDAVTNNNTIMYLIDFSACFEYETHIWVPINYLNLYDLADIQKLDEVKIKININEEKMIIEDEIKKDEIIIDEKVNHQITYNKNLYNLILEKIGQDVSFKKIINMLFYVKIKTWGSNPYGNLNKHGYSDDEYTYFTFDRSSPFFKLHFKDENVEWEFKNDNEIYFEGSEYSELKKNMRKNLYEDTEIPLDIVPYLKKRFKWLKFDLKDSNITYFKIDEIYEYFIITKKSIYLKIDEDDLNEEEAKIILFQTYFNEKNKLIKKNLNDIDDFTYILEQNNKISESLLNNRYNSKINNALIHLPISIFANITDITDKILTIEHTIKYNIKQIFNPGNSLFDIPKEIIISFSELKKDKLLNSIFFEYFNNPSVTNYTRLCDILPKNKKNELHSVLLKQPISKIIMPVVRVHVENHDQTVESFLNKNLYDLFNIKQKIIDKIKDDAVEFMASVQNKINEIVQINNSINDEMKNMVNDSNNKQSIFLGLLYSDMNFKFIDGNENSILYEIIKRIFNLQDTFNGININEIKKK